MTTFCTVIATNYLAHARVLARSIKKVDENAEVHVLVIDEPCDNEEDVYVLLTPQDIGLSASEFRTMAAIYDVSELSTAVKPWLLETLLRRTGAPVVYLDPDIEVYYPMDDVFTLAARFGIVLTPHTLAPIKRDGRSPDEPYILQAGSYNLGFLAVDTKAEPFLEWWKQRLRRNCLIDVDRGFFVDQKWVDLVPAYFQHFVLRDPGFNVAYWNADQRPLTRAGGRYHVAGNPLRFFHFSGFSVESPGDLCKYISSPRVTLTDYPDVARLCRRYANRLVSAGYLRCCDLPYEFDLSAGGLTLDPAVRRALRQGVIGAESGESDMPPDPFDLSAHGKLVDWLTACPDPTQPLISRYLASVYETRIDLQHAFPDLSGIEGQRLVDWAVIGNNARLRLVEGP